MTSELLLKCPESSVFLLPILTAWRFDNKLCHGSSSEGEVRALFPSRKRKRVHRHLPTPGECLRSRHSADTVGASTRMMCRSVWERRQRCRWQSALRTSTHGQQPEARSAPRWTHSCRSADNGERNARADSNVFCSTEASCTKFTYRGKGRFYLPWQITDVRIFSCTKRRQPVK